MMRRLATPLAALAVVSALYHLARPSRLPDSEAAALAARFAFEKTPLAAPGGVEPKIVRKVHPSLEHLSAQISFVGAAAALGDLDGDGLPNDLILVDPRTDHVLVTPVPGAGERYPPFELRPASLTYDVATTAPMGSLVGDFDEDGQADVLVYYWGRSPVMFVRRAGSMRRPGNDGPAAPAPASCDEVELVDPPERKS